MIPVVAGAARAGPPASTSGFDIAGPLDERTRFWFWGSGRVSPLGVWRQLNGSFGSPGGEEEEYGVGAAMTTGDSAWEEVLTGGLLRVSCLAFSLVKK
jgi:hypothetical protein